MPKLVMKTVIYVKNVPYNMHPDLHVASFLAFTDITFEQTQPAPRMFRLKFNKNNSPYFVQASEHNVTASQVSKDLCMSSFQY
jgi:hypothetical protein